MKEFKNELDRAEFQVFRMKVAIKSYLEDCKALDLEPERLDEMLDLLSAYMKKGDELKK